MFRRMILVCLILGGAVGCGGPSEDERENRKAFEFLLTAVALKNSSELEKDAERIEARHTAGQLSDARHAELKAIIDRARAGKWEEAERLAYAFREAQPYFK